MTPKVIQRSSKTTSWFQQARQPLPQKWGPGRQSQERQALPRNVEETLPHRGARRIENQTKGDYSQALRSSGIFLAKFWTHLGLKLLSSLFLPFGVGISILFLSHSIIVFWKHIACHRFTAENKFCLKMNCTSSFTQIGFTYLDEALNFTLQNWCWNELRFLKLLGWNECILHVRKT